MIKRIIHIVLVLLLAVGLKAQVVTPLGYGLPYTPEMVTEYQDGIAAVYIDASDVIKVQVWNGHFWYELVTPPLPTAGSNSYGYLEIKDLVQLNGKLYLLAEHTLDLMSNAPNFILEWNGSDWENLADVNIDNALVLNNLIYQSNKLQLVGIFSGDTTHHNIAEYNNGNWDLKGNLLTKNVVQDNFKTIINAHDKTYVTGKFTDPSVGTISLAEWNGSVWQNMAYPAFLGDNNTVGVFQDKLVVFGNNSFSSEKIKMQSGTSWTDITAGLEDYDIAEIDAFKQVGNTLYAVGDFIDQNNNNKHLMMYANGLWSAVETNVQFVSDAAISNNTLFVSGSFTDNQRLNNVGALSMDYALIVASVYNDKNGDCVKDANEEWIRNYPLSLNSEIDFLPTDKNGMMYISVPLKSYTLNANAIEYWTPTCSSESISASNVQVYDNYQFGVRKMPNVKDLTATLVDNQSYKALKGDHKTVLLCASNIGSAQAGNATIELNHDNSIGNFSSELAYTSYSGNKAIWTVTLDADQELCFYVSFDVLVDTEFELDATVKLSGTESDANAENNNSTLLYKTGETLANEKQCNNGEVIDRDEAYLNYKVGFKNVGSKDAVDLKIVDILDEDIVIGSKGVHYTYSHSCNLLPVEYIPLSNGGWLYKFIWEYENINLSNVTGAASEGFLDFNIYLKANRLTVGEHICNTAEIYYSYKKGTYNEPFTTNTVCSVVEQEVGVPSPISKIKGLSVGPVPSNNVLNFDNSTSEVFEISIVNAIGQQVGQLKVNKHTKVSLDISSYNTGAYLIYANGRYAQKVIIY